MLMPRRSFSSASAYKFGFNGKENDNEVKGLGNQQDYGMRIYDPRIGKFLSVDPLTSKYPMLTPYQFASNVPIAATDMDGLEMNPNAILGAFYKEEARLVQEGSKGNEEAQSAADIVRSVNMKIGFSQLGLTTSFVMGPYLGVAARTSTGVALRIAANPRVIASASTIGSVTSKYGPDAINFAYGLMTGDALEPLPTNTGSQSADAGAFLRGLFKAQLTLVCYN